MCVYRTSPCGIYTDLHKKPPHPFAAQRIFPYNQRTQVRVWQLRESVSWQSNAQRCMWMKYRTYSKHTNRTIINNVCRPYHMGCCCVLDVLWLWNLELLTVLKLGGLNWHCVSLSASICARNTGSWFRDLVFKTRSFRVKSDVVFHRCMQRVKDGGNPAMCASWYLNLEVNLLILY